MLPHVPERVGQPRQLSPGRASGMHRTRVLREQRLTQRTRMIK
jgi:hypothetical protein